MNHQKSTSKQPLQLFLLNLIADKAAGQQAQPLLVQDNARSHADDKQFVQKVLCQEKPATGASCNNGYKRQGAARWNDSFEVIENHQSPNSLLVSPNSVMAPLDRLVSPRRRESIVANSSGCCSTRTQLVRMCQQDKRAITGTTAAFLASLPMDDGNDDE